MASVATNFFGLLRFLYCWLFGVKRSVKSKERLLLADSVLDIVPSVGAKRSIKSEEKLPLADSVPSVDFVVLFHQHGLDYLTQEIMLLLVSNKEEECSLTEAKLVSCKWRETVDNAVLNKNVGQEMLKNRIKDVARR
jgi:hypothetical protein